MGMMTRPIMFIAAGAVVALAALVLTPSLAEADVIVAVSPSLIEVGVEPGARFDKVINVSNRGTDPAHLSVAVRAHVEDRPDIAAEGWFRTDPEEFDLGPGEGKQVSVQVNVPNDAKPGGRYATVFFRTSPRVMAGKGGRFSGGTGVGAEIGAVFLLTVRGPDLRLEGQLTKVVPVVTGPGRIGARVEITNTGNVHMFPAGQVEITDQAGNVVGKFTLPETTAILPGDTRSFYLQGVQDVPDGGYHASGAIEYGWSEEQIKAAQVDPEEWSHQEALKEITFNSIPKLRVVEVKLEGSKEEGAQFTLAMENYGDVEVSPAGFIDVLTPDGERVGLLNIGAGSWAIEPHSVATREYVHRDVLPKGKYTVAAELNYHGQDTAAKTVEASIKEEYIPPVAPQAPLARRMQYDPGTPVWIWLALASAGALAGTALGAAGWAVRRLAVQRANGAPKAGMPKEAGDDTPTYGL